MTFRLFLEIMTDRPANQPSNQWTNQSTDVRDAHCENVVKVLKFRAKITCTHKKKTVRCHFIIFFKSKMCIVLLSLTLLGLNIIFLQIDHRLVTKSEAYLENFTGVTIRNQILIPTKIMFLAFLPKIIIFAQIKIIVRWNFLSICISLIIIYS